MQQVSLQSIAVRTVASALLVLSFLAAEHGFAQETEYLIDFEQPAQPARFAKTDWVTHSSFEVGFVNGPERASLDSTQAHTGKQSLRIEFPIGSVGPEQGGHQASLLLEPGTQYCLSYWLRFSENFSWGGIEHGGKLPGLGQGRLCSGGDTCNGANGFTARYMWRRNGAAVLYLYHMDKPRRWGEDFPLRPGGEPYHFTPGTWVNLAQRVRINSGTAADGEVQVWVDGREALNLDGLRFVTDGSGIDTLYISTFHGGNTPEWGPRNDSSLWIDDIRITPGEQTCASSPDGRAEPPRLTGSSGTLTVYIKDLASDDGNLRFVLFDSEQNFLKQPLRTGIVEIENRQGTWKIESLPYGTYAVLVHHDTDMSGKLERHWYGKPKEPTGTSNDPPTRFGPPKFEDAKFTFDSPARSLSIRVE